MRQTIGSAIDEFMSSLPARDGLSAEEQRAIIRRYTAVLEGNFIYWMTGAYLAAKSEEARKIILENLHEEVRDSHPRMLRKFALAARSVPTDSDALAIDSELTGVRLFVGRLSTVPILVMMAFFEGLIQKFMAYLADLAETQGSSEREYTDVHGVCDITHTEELWHALSAEMALDPPAATMDVYEGVDLLRKLLEVVINPAANNRWTQPIC